MGYFPVIQQRKFFLGKDLDADNVPGLTWFAPDLGKPRWQDAKGRTLCFQLDTSEDGSHLRVKHLFVILNARYEPQWVKLPPLDSGRAWHRAIDTSIPGIKSFAGVDEAIVLDPPDRYIANPRSTVVLLARAPG